MNTKPINAIIAYTTNGYEVELTHVCFINSKVVGTLEDTYGTKHPHSWDVNGKSLMDYAGIDLCMESFPKELLVKKELLPLSEFQTVNRVELDRIFEIEDITDNFDYWLEEFYNGGSQCLKHNVYPDLVYTKDI